MLTNVTTNFKFQLKLFKNRKKKILYKNLLTPNSIHLTIIIYFQILHHTETSSL